MSDEVNRIIEEHDQASDRVRVFVLLATLAIVFGLLWVVGP